MYLHVTETPKPIRRGETETHKHHKNKCHKDNTLPLPLTEPKTQCQMQTNDFDFRITSATYEVTGECDLVTVCYRTTEVEAGCEVKYKRDINGAIAWAQITLHIQRRMYRDQNVTYK